MGKRLHVQKKHVIEYADCEFFNWGVEDINDFLCRFCEGYWGNDEEYGSYSDMIEIPKDSFKDMLDNLKDDEKRQAMFDEEGYKFPESMFYLEDLIKGFETLYNESDPDQEYIYLNWF